MNFYIFIFITICTILNHHGIIVPDMAHTHIIDDFSHLNKTVIREFITPENYEELIKIVERAGNEHLKISIAGARHSQGGHAFYPDGIVISLKKLNKIINLDTNEKFITVQTGATWKQVQEYLNAHNLAVKIMQFANFFTIGGALSVNANGIDPHYGPFIQSVRCIKILLADGTIVNASRTENADLFRLAIGGYGLFGIILEVTMEVTNNDIYKKETSFLALDDYVHFLRTMNNDPSLGFHFAQFLMPVNESSFSEVMVFNYKKIDENTLSHRKKKYVKKFYKEQYVAIKKIGMKFLRQSSFAKAMQGPADGVANGSIISRNNIMSPHLSHIYLNSSTETDLLQEYFVPLHNLIPFIEALSVWTKKFNINILQVALRYIPHNTESFLSYSRNDCVGVVLFLNQKLTDDATKKTKKWTQHLIDTVSKLDGTYYLPIQLHASKEQLEKAYPTIDTFFGFKKQFDPQLIFMNYFYQKYALSR